MTDGLDYSVGGQCSFPATFGNVRTAVARLMLFCRSHGMAADHLQTVELAATEAANNAAEHGAGLNPSLTIHMAWEWRNDLFRITVRDPGTFQPPPDSRQPDDPLSERGRGLFLLGQLADRVEHRQLPEGHELLLEKTTGPASFHSESPAEIEQTLYSMTEELSVSYENLSTLFRLGDALATSTDFQGFLGRSLQELQTLLDCDWVYLAERSSEPRQIFTRFQVGKPVEDFPAERPDRSAYLESRVFETRKDLTVEINTDLDPQDPLRRTNQYLYCCPVPFGESILSLLVLTRDRSKPYFNAGQLHVARTFADFLGIAIALENIQRRRSKEQRVLRDLEIAAEIQQQLLPTTFPSAHGYTTHGICRSARQVGGDFLDAFPVGKDGIFLLIADVMGKGVSAALLATILRTALHARIGLANEPERLMSEIGSQLYRDLGHLEMFITCQCVYADLVKGELTLCSAGHGPALLIPARGPVREINPEGGLPLGIMDDKNYGVSRLALEPGDRLALLTDGLFEAESPGGELLGVQRLMAMSERLRPLPVPHFCSELLSGIESFCGNNNAGDDRSLLILERLAHP